MKLRVSNKVIAIMIILTNIYFVPSSYVVIRDEGGPMGYGLLVLPILLSANSLLITALLTFKKKFNNSPFLLTVNGLGLLWNLFWLWLILIVP